MLSVLEKLAASFWGFVTRIAGLILPFFSRASDVRKLGGRGIWWILHIVVVLCLLGLLYWINNHPRVNLPEVIDSKPIPIPGIGPVNIKPYYLPLLFILVYILCWLGWWLWKLLGPEEELIEFPDIEEAWEEALVALNQAGIGLSEAPLFLIVGRPQGSETALMQAADLQLIVKQVPLRLDAPIHVHANREGIYVTCAGASLLGRHAELLTEKAEFGGEGFQSALGESAAEEAGDDEFKTVRPGQGRGAAQQKEIQAILQRANAEGRELNEEEKQKIRFLGGMDGPGQEQPLRRAGVNLLKNTAEKERCGARLRYLCRLIVRDRRPYCPLNGMMLLVPLAGSETEEDANQTGAIAQIDLMTARQALQVQCPLFALICDLETLPGFREFIERFPQQQRRNRLGQRFPLLPDLNDNDSVQDKVDGSVQWICQSVMPTWIYKLFQLERGRDDYSAAAKGNAQLYRLLSAITERQKRLGRIVARALVAEQSAPWLFGGSYLAGTGRDSAREQAFIAGVFRRLLDHQSAISWTPDALADDADYVRWSTLGYSVMTVLAVAGIGAVFYFLNRQ